MKRTLNFFGQSTQEEISNNDLPIAGLLRDLLNQIPAHGKTALFGEMTEDEFVLYRVGIFLEEIDKSLGEGLYPEDAEEIAFVKCLAGISL